MSSDARGPLGPIECRVLADALGDTPKTTISAHLLRRGLCRAYVVGEPSNPIGAIVQDLALPSEPTGFGTDPDVLWRLLQAVEGWDCTDVECEAAPALGAIITRETGSHVRYYGDIFHTLTIPPPDFHIDAVRRLTPDDFALLAAAPPELQVNGFGGLREMLAEGITAGAVVDGRLVGIVQTYARTRQHADLGVYTLAGWRGRGFATAAAAIVARCVQEAGQTPVWDTGEGNAASLSVARKLGFTEVARRTYVILERE
jgi:GNAT superfamily N-acetyltransferase